MLVFLGLREDASESLRRADLLNTATTWHCFPFIENIDCFSLTDIFEVSHFFRICWQILLCVRFWVVCGLLS